MEKKYLAIAIKKITDNILIYEDEANTEQFINLLKCRDNWYYSNYKKESFVSKVLQKRKKCKYVGNRFWGYGEAYFEFYSDDKIKFVIELNEDVESDDYCEKRQYFGYIKQQLNNAGWITFDVG